VVADVESRIQRFRHGDDSTSGFFNRMGDFIKIGARVHRIKDGVGALLDKPHYMRATPTPVGAGDDG
jgi:hypothetical protein